MKVLILMSQVLLSCSAISFPGKDKEIVTLIKTLTIAQNREFLRIEEVGSDRHGNIYITDAYRYNIKKYSPAGKLLGEYGRRGNDANEFVAPPYKIICHDDIVAVIAKGTARVQIFTDNFKYKCQFSLPGTIVDIIFDQDGRIVAGIIPNDQSEQNILFLLDKAGKIIASAEPYQKNVGPAFNIMHIAAGKNNKIIVAYRFTNIVQLLTGELKLIKMFSVPDLLPEAPSTIGISTGIGKIPEGDLIKDVAIDTGGNIFILSGEYNVIPNRTVYLFDPEGNFITKFHLEKKSGILYIDNYGSIYTRENERSILSRYTITYHKK